MPDGQQCDNCIFWTSHQSGQAGECSAMSNTDPGNIVRMILIRMNPETGGWQPNFDRNVSVAVGRSTPTAGRFWPSIGPMCPSGMTSKPSLGHMQ